MKKRVLSAFMALALCLTLLPTAALADEAEHAAAHAAEHDIAVQAAGGAVAEVTVNGKTTQYTDFSKAAEKATETDGCTLTLLADTEVSEALTLSARTNPWTFDLNGKTLTQSGTASDDAFLTFYSGTVTIVDNVGTGKVIGVNRAIYASSNITLNITGGTFVGKNSNGLLARSGAKVKLSGGTFYTENEDEPHSIWYNESNVKSLLAKGYRYQNADGAASGFGGKYASTDWYQGVVGWTTIAPIPEREINYINKDGSTAARDTFTQVTGETAALTAGWYVAEGDITVTSLDVSGEVNLILCDGAALTVSGGLTVEGSGNKLNLYFQENGTGKLTAKTVSGEENITAPAGEMKKTTDTSGTTFEKCLNHAWKESTSGGTTILTCSLCGAARTGGIAATLYPNGSTDIIPYPTFEEALSAAKKSNNCILKLMADVTTTEMITISEGTFELDLNGKTLTCTGSSAEYALTVSGDALLSILDTGDGGTIKGPDCGIHVTGGILRISGGTFIGVQSNGLLVEQGCDVKLSGGTFDSENEEYSILVMGTGKAGNLLESGYGYRQDNNSLSEYNALGNGVKGKTTVREGDAAEIPEHKHTYKGGENYCATCKQVIVAYDNKASDENTNYYISLNEAFEQVADGGAITTLLSPITETVTFDRESSIRLKGLDMDYLQSTSQKDATLTVSAGTLTLEQSTSELTAPFHIDNFGGGPAVLVTGPTDGTGGSRLILNGKVYFNGGLKVTGTGCLYDTSSGVRTGLPEGSILERGDGAFSVSVEDSMMYKNVLGLLPDGCAFAKYENGQAGDIISGNVEKLTENVIVVEHTTHEIDPETKLCECGFQCDHEGGTAFVKGVCKICGTACEHKVGTNIGTCGQCGLALAAEVTNSLGGYLRGYTDVSEAIKNAPDGSTVTVIAENRQQSIKANTSVSSDVSITLDLNGHTLDGYSLTVGETDLRGNPTGAGKLTVIDSDSSGNGRVGIVVRGNGTLIFNPGNKTTTLSQLEVYNQQVELYGGRIERTSDLTLGDGIKLTDLLPAGYAFGLYSNFSASRDGAILYSAAEKNDMSAWKSGQNLVIELCEHTDVDPATGICLYCSAGIQAKVTVTSGSSTTDTLFPTLQEALLSDLVQNTVDAVGSDSCTVTLLQDLDMGSDALLLGNGNYTLDLGGHEIKGKGKSVGNDNYLLAQKPGNGKIRNLTITIQNGKLTCSGNLNFAVQFSCNRGDSINVTLNVNVVGGVLAYSNVNLKLTGGTYQANPNWGTSSALQSDSSNLSGLLAEGMLFWDEEDKVLDLSSVNQTAKTVTVRACDPHEWQNGECTKCHTKCSHSYDNGVCTICGYACPHPAERVAENDGVYTCSDCNVQMVVKVEAGEDDIKTTAYYAKHHEARYPYAEDTLKQVFMNAESGSTVTLLADGLYAFGWATGKTITLDMNGKNLIENNGLVVASDDDNNCGKLIVTGRGSSKAPEGSWYPCTFRVLDGCDLVFDEGFSGGYGTIYLESGTLTSNSTNMTFDALEIQSSSAAISLKGGTFGKICVSGNWGSVTLGDLLAKNSGCAFQDADGKFVLYNTTIDGSHAVENVKIATCTHDSVANGTCDYCGTEHIVAAYYDPSNGGVTTYVAESDSAEAINSSVNDVLGYMSQGTGTLKLFVDAALQDLTIDTSSRRGTDYHNELVIDLNGHKLTGGTLTVTGNGKLTITDSSASKSGSFTNVTVNGGASLTVDGVTVGTVSAAGKTADGKSPSITLKPGTKFSALALDGSNTTLGYSGLVIADCLEPGSYLVGLAGIFPGVGISSNADKPITVGQIEGVVTVGKKTGSVPYHGNVSEALRPIVTMNDGSTPNLSYTWYYHTSTGSDPLSSATAKVGDELNAFCFITARDESGSILWETVVTGYTLTVTTANLADATVTVTNADSLVYTPTANGSEMKTLQFTVTHNGNTLMPGRDYRVTDTSDQADQAGTHTLTLEGIGNYAGTLTQKWSIRPCVLTGLSGTISLQQIKKTYDGTTALPENLDFKASFTFSKGEESKIHTLATGEYTLTGSYDTASVGDGKTVTLTVQLTGGNYTFAEGKTEQTFTLAIGSIEKAAAPTVQPGELTIKNELAATYTYDISQLLPALDGQKEYEISEYLITRDLPNTYCTEDIKIDENGLLTLKIREVASTTEGQVGTIQVFVMSNNYGNFYLTILVKAENKIAPTGAPTLSPAAITYGDKLRAITLSGALKDGDQEVPGTFVWVAPDTAPDAGSYDAEWRFTPAAEVFQDYRSVTGTVTINVQQAASAVTKAPAANTPTYSGSDQELLTGGSCTGGKLVYSTTKTGTYAETIPTGRDAGSYSVWYKVEGDKNHTDTDPVEVKVTIQPKTLSARVEVTTSEDELRYSGQPLTPDVAVYDGQTVIDPSEYTVSYSNNVNAGTGTAKVIITNNEGGNYVVSGSADFSILKGFAQTLNQVQKTLKYSVKDTQTITLPSLNELGMPDDANVLAQAAFAAFGCDSAGTLVAESPTLDADTGAITFTLTDLAKAGDVIHFWMNVCSQNYEDSTLDIYLTLTDRDEPVVSADAITVTYDGSAVPAEKITGTATFGGKSVPGLWSWAEGQSRTNVTDSGEKTVVFTPSDLIRYKPVKVTLTLTINPAALTGTAAVTELTHGGLLGDVLITPDASWPDGSFVWLDASGQILSTSVRVVANTAYTWEFRPTDAHNYLPATGSAVLWHYEPITPVGPSRPSEPDEPEAPLFDDVSDDDYFGPAVRWAAENGITSGIGGGLFGPERACTRAQIVTFLWRAAGSPAPRSSEMPFADVPADSYYYSAVLWAVENGITSGTASDRFSPDAICTRAQAVTFLYRAAGMSGDVTAETAFTDVPADSYYAKAVAWAVEHGITTGVGNGKFDPNGTCTRAQIVTFLHRSYLSK